MMKKTMILFQPGLLFFFFHSCLLTFTVPFSFLLLLLLDTNPCFITSFLFFTFTFAITTPYPPPKLHFLLILFSILYVLLLLSAFSDHMHEAGLQACLHTEAQPERAKFLLNVALQREQ